MIHLYHLSTDPNLKTMVPRVPRNARVQRGQEDGVTKRICFAPSIHDATAAAPSSAEGAMLYVYSPVSIDPKAIYYPSPFQVGDVKYTHEVWYTKPCNVKKVAVILVGDVVREVFAPHPDAKKFPGHYAQLTWKTYKKFNEVPTSKQRKEYLEQQKKYQASLREERKGLILGAFGSLAVFALIGGVLKLLKR